MSKKWYAVSANEVRMLYAPDNEWEALETIRQHAVEEARSKGVSTLMPLESCHDRYFTLTLYKDGHVYDRYTLIPSEDLETVANVERKLDDAQRKKNIDWGKFSKYLTLENLVDALLNHLSDSFLVSGNDLMRILNTIKIQREINADTEQEKDYYEGKLQHIVEILQSASNDNDN